MELSPQLAAVAARQHGLFTTAQLFAAGYDAAEAKRLLRAGVWTRVRRGIYMDTADLPDDPAARHLVGARAVLLRVREPAYASHLTAIAVHGLPTYEADWSAVHITRPGLAASRLEAGIHHHAGHIPESHLQRVAGIDVTSVAWSLIDFARECSFEQATVAADAAIRAGQTTSDTLREALFVCRDWPGARNAGRVVSFASGLSESPGESLSRIAFELEGLPQPQQQVEIRDRGGLVARVDFLWADQRTIGEFDGRIKYTGDAARLETLYAEKRREDRLRDLGFEVVRFGYVDVVEYRAALARRIRAAFARAAKRPA